MLPVHAPLPETILIRHPRKALSIGLPAIGIRMRKKLTSHHSEIGMWHRHESQKTKHPHKH
jgi:hypothetical protein